MKLKPSLALLAAISTAAAAQTTTTTPKKSSTTTAAHRTTTSAHAKPAATPAPAVNPADNPPNVPKVEGAPKPLYALRYIDISVGTGDLAQPRRFYTVHYTGWLTDGTKFDSSVDRGTPISFPYGARRVIPGWDTGFEGMHVGGKRRLFIPYQLAYGESGRPPVIPPKSDLIFDIELVSQSETDPNAAPPAAAPAENKPATPNPDTKPATPNPDTKPATPNPDTKTPPHPETR
jgi:peptidylprolyl isomerase